MSVNATKGKPSTHQAHYNHCLFRHQFGWRFLWISLQVFQSQGTIQSSWWLWTDCRSMLISAPYPTRLHQLWSLNISWTQIFKLHGMPTSIVSDRDPIFTSNFWQELFRIQGTQLKLSTSYHPQTDGQTEAINKCLETYLRCFTSEKQHLWVQWLPMAEWWYNTNYHATTKMTPYEAVYGQLPPSPTSYLKGCSKVQAVDQLLQHRATMLAHLRENLHQAQNRMKQQVDQHRSEREFQEGDQVFLRLQSYKQTSLKDKGCQKLSPKFYGPYQVLQRIGEVAYKLALPPTAKIHQVFHVSCLKKVIGNNCRI